MSKEIVMVHGWETQVYNSKLNCENVSEDIAWRNRENLIKQLRKKHPLRFFNLPGFCCVKEPNQVAYDIEDFSDYFAKWLTDQDIKLVAIVGYSFGGVVALDYKVRYKSDVPVVLISPALKRRETIKSQIGRIGKSIAPQKYSDSLKSLYQSIFSKYYRHGTPFLRASYDKIARRDARLLLEKVVSEEIILVYGDSDKSTPVQYISNLVNQNHLRGLIIKGGDHNIGSTHPEQILTAITNFLLEHNDP